MWCNFSSHLNGSLTVTQKQMTLWGRLHFGPTFLMVVALRPSELRSSGIARWTQHSLETMVMPFFVLISECHFGDGPSLFKHIANAQKSTSKSVSISQLDVIMTPNGYQLTPNPLFPTHLVANYHICQSRPIIHSAFSLKHNKKVKHIVTF
jgi:hypothetical protein